MKVILAWLFVLGGLLNGEEPEWAKKKLACELKVIQKGKVRKGSQGYGLEVRLTYDGPKQQMVSRWKTLTFALVTKDGEEISIEPWGADGTRARGLSDYRMMRGGETSTWRFGATVSKREGKWEFTWSDPFGSWHGCRLDSMNGVKLVVKYSNEVKEDLEVKGSGGAVLQVPKEQIWSGTVRSKAVPLRE